MSVFELGLNTESEINPETVNKYFLDYLFNVSYECLAIDYTLFFLPKMKNDSRPKLTAKSGYSRDRPWLLKSSMRGESLFVISGQSTENIVQAYRDLVSSGVDVEALEGFHSIPVDDSVINKAMEVARLFNFSESVVFFSHDGYPVFVWTVDRSGSEVGAKS